jgi:transposase-like protein
LLSHAMSRNCSPNVGSRSVTRPSRLWCRKFGPLLASELRRRHPRRGDRWYLDEVALTINKASVLAHGVPSTRMELCWTFWFRVDVISTPQNAS